MLQIFLSPLYPLSRTQISWFLLLFFAFWRSSSPPPSANIISMVTMSAGSRGPLPSPFLGLRWPFGPLGGGGGAHSLTHSCMVSHRTDGPTDRPTCPHDLRPPGTYVPLLVPWECLGDSRGGLREREGFMRGGAEGESVEACQNLWFSLVSTVQGLKVLELDLYGLWCQTWSSSYFRQIAHWAGQNTSVDWVIFPRVPSDTATHH